MHIITHISGILIKNCPLETYAFEKLVIKLGKVMEPLQVWPVGGSISLGGRLRVCSLAPHSLSSHIFLCNKAGFLSFLFNPSAAIPSFPLWTSTLERKSKWMVSSISLFWSYCLITTKTNAIILSYLFKVHRLYDDIIVFTLDINNFYFLLVLDHSGYKWTVCWMLKNINIRCDAMNLIR